MNEEVEKELPTIFDKCFKALKRGLFAGGEEEQGYIDKVTLCRDFDWFLEERRTVRREYEKFCAVLEKRLETIRELPDPVQKACALLPLYRKAIEISGKKRALDISFKQSNNLLDYYIENARNIVEFAVDHKVRRRIVSLNDKERTVHLLLWDGLLIMHPHQSYELALLADMCLLLGEIKQVGNESQFDLQKIVEILKSMIDTAKGETKTLLDRCLQLHGGDHIWVLASKVLKFHAQIPNEQIELLDLEETRRKNSLKKAEAFDAVCQELDDEKKKQFTHLLDRIQTLLYINAFEDPASLEFFLGVPDYFLRNEVAMTLFTLGKIPTPDPLSHHQNELLALMENTCCGLTKKSESRENFRKSEGQIVGPVGIRTRDQP